jgi:large subunit ribosomal protein L28
LRTIEHRGGFDAYLLGANNGELDLAMRRLKKQVEKAVAAR